MHDVAIGKLPVSAVSLEQWLIAHAWAMTTDMPPRLTKTILVNGVAYEMYFMIQAISYPAEASAIMGEHH